ncbi:MAG: RDD family protein [Pseudomonadota bacterium]
MDVSTFRPAQNRMLPLVFWPLSRMMQRERWAEPARQGAGALMDYAGFWVRFFAYILDFFVFIILALPLVFLFGTPEFDAATGSTSYSLPEYVTFPIFLAYFVGFEGSPKQATPGKMAMGLVVTNQAGGRLSWPHALARFLAKFLSLVVFLIGFVMVAFTPRKQGLHDLLARTLVVRGRPGQIGFDPDEFA